jgi:hypothetical protein
MPDRKKSKKKRTKTKTAKSKQAKKALRAKRAVKPRRPKNARKKTQAVKKTSSKTTVALKRKSSRSSAQQLESFPDRERALAGRQAGDLQGLSRAEEADSESVDELVEEGNLFEAGAVAGVEDADNADEKEVHTHELPEDDVPEEYLDKE